MFIEEGTHAEYIFRRNKEETINIFKTWFRQTIGAVCKD